MMNRLLLATTCFCIFLGWAKLVYACVEFDPKTGTYTIDKLGSVSSMEEQDWSYPTPAQPKGANGPSQPF